MEFDNHVFLSYSRRDTEMMQRIRDSLRESGFRVWTDERLVAGTPSWKGEIEKGIAGAGCIVVVLSPDAKKSEWVERELDYGRTLGKQIFPVIAKGDKISAIPFQLINIQYVNALRDFDTAMGQLKAGLNGLFGSESITDKISEKEIYAQQTDERLSRSQILRLIYWFVWHPNRINRFQSFYGKILVEDFATLIIMGLIWLTLLIPLVIAFPIQNIYWDDECNQLLGIIRICGIFDGDNKINVFDTRFLLVIPMLGWYSFVQIGREAWTVRSIGVTFVTIIGVLILGTLIVSVSYVLAFLPPEPNLNTISALFEQEELTLGVILQGLNFTLLASPLLLFAMLLSSVFTTVIGRYRVITGYLVSLVFLGVPAGLLTSLLPNESENSYLILLFVFIPITALFGWLISFVGNTSKVRIAIRDIVSNSVYIQVGTLLLLVPFFSNEVLSSAVQHAATAMWSRYGIIAFFILSIVSLSFLSLGMRAVLDRQEVIRLVLAMLTNCIFSNYFVLTLLALVLGGEILDFDRNTSGLYWLLLQIAIILNLLGIAIGSTPSKLTLVYIPTANLLTSIVGVLFAIILVVINAGPSLLYDNFQRTTMLLPDLRLIAFLLALIGSAAWGMLYGTRSTKVLSYIILIPAFAFAIIGTSFQANIMAMMNLMQDYSMQIGGNPFRYSEPDLRISMRFVILNVLLVVGAFSLVSGMGLFAKTHKSVFLHRVISIYCIGVIFAVTVLYALNV